MWTTLNIYVCGKVCTVDDTNTRFIRQSKSNEFRFLFFVHHTVSCIVLDGNKKLYRYATEAFGRDVVVEVFYLHCYRIPSKLVNCWVVYSTSILQYPTLWMFLYKLLQVTEVSHLTRASEQSPCIPFTRPVFPRPLPPAPYPRQVPSQIDETKCNK